jgi:predicted site-specific integrase-resolvase
MSNTLHHKKVTELTGYSRIALFRFVRNGVIECQRDRHGYIRFDMKAVEQLIARAARNERQRAAAKRRYR